MQAVKATIVVLMLLLPSRGQAQADSARRAADSLPADSARADSQPAPKKAAPPAAPAPAVRTLGAGECPPAGARAQGDALHRFAAPRARPPVALATPVLRDPSLRGRTTLALEVDTLGRADSTTVRIVDGDPYLLPTARSSVARWRFRPAELLPGCPVRARTIETVTF
ncbi:MAG TPA: hypothetical protein VFY20_12625 [Gemmatimonadales bacterium]|nr:hypothetical protein [Gemmatimonadales bacterium]